MKTGMRVGTLRIWVLAAIVAAGMATAANCGSAAEKKEREFYLPVKLQGLGNAWVTSRLVYFTELLAAAGEKRPVDPLTLRVVKVTASGTNFCDVPWNYLPDENKVMWPVDAFPMDATAEYRIYIRVGTNPHPGQGKPAMADPTLAPNLFSPGDFESPTDCWMKQKNASASRDMEIYKNGKSSLRMAGGNVQIGVTPATPRGIPVMANQTYRVSFCLKGGGRLLRTVAAFYYDAKGASLGRDMMSGMLRSKGLVSSTGSAELPAKEPAKEFDWTPVSFSVATKPGTEYLRIGFLMREDGDGGTGSLWVDDLRVEPIQSEQIVDIVDTATKQAFSVAAPVVEGLRCFDFGKAESPVFEGFTKMSGDMLYEKERGFGFKNKSQKNDDSIYPEPLSADYVMCDGQKTMTFLVDLPDGDYRVWVLSGANPLSGYYPLRCPYEIRVSGGDALKVAITPENYHRDFFFRGYYDFIRQDDGLPVNVYERYFRPLFREKTLSATVKGGQLVVEVVPGKSAVPSGVGYLNALVIYPIANEKAGEAYLDWMNRKRARACVIKEIVVNDPAPSPEPTAEEKDRGYILFTRPWEETFRPNTKPLADQKLGSLRVAAIAGEFEPVALCVYPLQELGNCRMTVGDLIGPEGKTIPAKQVEISVVRFFAGRVQPTSKIYAIEGYRREGTFVLHGDTASVHMGTSREFLLTITTPSDLPRGLYKGKITVIPEKGKPAEIELAVLSIPLRLIPPAGWHTSFRYNRPMSYDQYIFPEMADAMEKMHIAELKHMKHFRNTSAMSQLRGPWVWVDGKAVRAGQIKGDSVNPARMDVFFRWFKETELPAYAAAGITEIPLFLSLVPQHGEINEVDYRGNQDFTKALYAGCKDLPYRLIYDFGGEFSNDGERGGIKAKRGYSWVKETFPDMLTGATLNGKYCLMTLGYVDYVGLRAYMFSDKSVQEIHEKKGEVYIYGYSDRFTNGLFMWRVRAKGNYLTEYYIRTAHGELFNDFDFSVPDVAWTHALPSPDGPVPHVYLYSRAAGFLDALTLYTLEALIAKAQAGGKEKTRAQAAEAKKYIDDLRAGIPDEHRLISETGAKPTATTMDRTRLTAALKAYELQQALEKGE